MLAASRLRTSITAIDGGEHHETTDYDTHFLLDLSSGQSDDAVMLDPWSPHASVLREKVFEHLFLGDLTRSLLRAGRRCEVLRAEYDGSGYDLVLEADGVLRHVQLKAMRADGKRAHVDIHVDLASKPSGCVVWMLIDPETFLATGYRWFGASAGSPLPDLGDRATRHTKADSQGLKAERPMLRRLPRSSFETLSSIDELIQRLFGKQTEDSPRPSK